MATLAEKIDSREWTTGEKPTVTMHYTPDGTRDGFLGDDKRPLAEILEADNTAVERLGLTHQKLADRLARQAMAAPGATVHPGEHLTAVYRESMGRIPCPWIGCGVFAKGEVELVDTQTKQKVLFSPLSVHLIARHGFYQGHGARYHIEPDDLARILRLK